ncbi:MAG: hypothetical protein ABIN18_10190 [Pseudomonadota bacterium]
MATKNKPSEEMGLEETINIVTSAGFYVARDREEIKQIAIKFGYRVFDPIKVKTDVDSIPQIVRYFYNRLYKKYPNRNHIPNFGRDNSIAKQFVESRMKGVDKKVAIQECVGIIDVIFDYEKQFNFQYPINDMGILGQSKMSWVTEKAISILNYEREKEKERRVEEILQEWERARPIDLKARGRELEQMLAELEASNA